LALAAHWEAKGHAPATLQNALSTLRVFAGWIGKPGLVPDSKALVSSPGKATRSGAALEDKGWDGKGIDIPALTEKIRAIDPRVALQIELQRAFGLRSEESWKLMPRYHLFQTEIGVWALNLCKGTKGGKPRIVFLTRQTQWDALERAEALAGAGSLIPPGKTEGQWANRYYYVLRKAGVTRKDLGVTAHGNRHDFAHLEYELKFGVPAPVRGGGEPNFHPEEVKRIKHYLSEQLGHSRIQIVGAYTGTQRSVKKARLTWALPGGGGEAATRSDAEPRQAEGAGNPDGTGGG
jgi:integrase